MKKIFYLFVLMTAVMLTSCSHDFEPWTMQQQKDVAFTQSFVKTFGVPSANNTWGDWSVMQSEQPAGARAITRSANTNGNEWANYVEVPGAITDAELQKVLTVFNQKWTNEPVIKLNWSDFFVQQVYKGTAQVTDKAGNTFTASDKMNKLVVYFHNNGVETNEHVNNFNNGNNTTYGGLMLMQNSGTERFAYSNSNDGGKNYFKYRLEEIDGSFYLGFDFDSHGNNPNEQVDGDDIYNDWIVKIIPTSYKNAKTIIAEDLGTTDDFDFNDIVAEVYINYNEWWHDNDYAVIKVLAAGGTLPAYICGKEVHELLGITEGTMANTAGSEGNHKVLPAIFHVKGSFASYKDIAITVENNGAILVINAETGKAPQKIIVHKGFRWPTGRTNIKNAYPKFQEYVTTGNENSTDWEYEFVEDLVY